MAGSCGAFCSFCGRCGRKIDSVVEGIEVPKVAPPGVDSGVLGGSGDVAKGNPEPDFNLDKESRIDCTHEKTDGASAMPEIQKTSI